VERNEAGTPVLSKAEARQAQRAGWIWILLGSLGLASLAAIALLVYFWG
jgi:hypothetical protein